MTLDVCSRPSLEESRFLDDDCSLGSSLFSVDLTNSCDFDALRLTAILPPTPEHEWDGPDFDFDAISPVAAVPNHSYASFEKLTCRCQCPILRDCMWSANWSIRIPSPSLDGSYRRPYETSYFPVTGCNRCVEMDPSTCVVDTQSVFNYIPAAQSLLPQPPRAPQSIKMEVDDGDAYERLSGRMCGTMMTAIKQEVTSDYDESFASNTSSGTKSFHCFKNECLILMWYCNFFVCFFRARAVK